nr:di-heme oxidoredictase family protein [Candidatus Halocynthiibacter alkanivorans]
MIMKANSGRNMRPVSAILTGLAAATFATSSAQAESAGSAVTLLGEPHLNILPRTEAEEARIAPLVAPTDQFAAPENFETRAGGGSTKFNNQTRDAFSFASSNMAFSSEMDFKVGNGFFKKLWVTAPASTVSSDGLGPIYNARACQRCHIKDGRGHTPQGDEDTGVSMFMRISIPKDASDLSEDLLAYMANAPEPNYGTQIQDKSIAGHSIEARMQIDYTPLPVTLGDGGVITLRSPAYGLSDLGYGALHPQAQLSPRVSPQMIGLGLLEAVREADILAIADPEDADDDGISGRPNRVWSGLYNQWMLGRFGLKAGAATIQEQSMGAFAGDMGLSNPLHPAGSGECTALQTDCLAAPDGNTPSQDNLEVSEQVMDLVTFYARNLAVPARRDEGDVRVLRGKEMFYASGCTSCHTPKYVTHRLSDRPEQSFQLIWPYTDMLLHDMGPGLADNRPEWQADGQEWRTAPLWGIGMTETVSGHTEFLHDGRAQSLLEAMLWHGGEAEAAKETVRLMPADDRAALIAFLESL